MGNKESSSISSSNAVPDDSSSSQRFYVTIPRGALAGQYFKVLVNGEEMMVLCPEGKNPGDKIITIMSGEKFLVTVPPNVKVGDKFAVKVKNIEIMVRVIRSVLFITPRSSYIIMKIDRYDVLEERNLDRESPSSTLFYRASSLISAQPALNHHLIQILLVRSGHVSR